MPVNGFNQQISLARSGMPKYVTCEVNLATITPAGTTHDRNADHQDQCRDSGARSSAAILTLRRLTVI